MTATPRQIERAPNTGAPDLNPAAFIWLLLESVLPGPFATPQQIKSASHVELIYCPPPTWRIRLRGWTLALICAACYLIGWWSGRTSPLPLNDQAVLDTYHSAQAGNPFGGK